MSLQFILGGSGSGKSSALYEMVIDYSVSDPKGKGVLIVPDQYTMQTQKNIVNLHPDHGVMNVDIVSFNRLAYRVFEELGTATLTVLDDTGKNMIIRHLLADHREDMGTFRGNVRKSGFSSQLKSMISELLQYDVSPELLREKCGELGADNRLYGKLKDIQMIYASFMDFIADHYITTEEILDRLCEVIDESSVIKDAVVYMDNFTGFTPVQYKLIRKILIQAKKVIISLPADGLRDTYILKGKEDIFYLTKDTMNRLEELCQELGVDRDQDIILKGSKGRFKNNPELAAIERSIFRTWMKPCHEKSSAVCICQAADPVTEMQYTASKIHSLVSSGKYRYSEIAVISSDMSRYTGAARYWFDLYDIPCFMDERRDISGNMLVRWMSALFEMLVRDFSYESVFAYLRCSFSGFERRDVDLLEDYVLKFGIRGFSRWEKIWTASSYDVSDEMLARLNSLRKDFINSIKPLHELTGRKKATVHEIIVAVYLFMKAVKIGEQTEQTKLFFEESGDLSRAREYEQIYDVVIHLFEKIDSILGKDIISIRDFADLFTAGIEEEKIGIIPPGVDQVTFGDLRRSRVDHIKVLFFAGMNDDLVPAVVASTGLITDFERNTLSEIKLELAPTAKEKLCTERYYLYASLSKPSEKLILTYCNQGSDGKEKRPSELLRQIHQILPELREEVFTDQPKSFEGKDWHQAYRYMLQGLRKLGDGEETEKAWKDVFDWFYMQTDSKDDVRELLDAAFFKHQDEKLSKAAVRAVYEGKLTGGVTMLEKYAQCAYAHFLAYGLRLKEREVYEVQAFDIGRIFHLAIELFSNRIEHSGYQWRDIPDDIRNQMVSECVQSVVSRYNHALLMDNKRGEYLITKIERMTKRTVWALQQQIIKGDFNPAKYEMKFEAEVESDIMQIRCGEEGLLSLKGKIDRADFYEEDGKTYVKIVDYKTGATKFDLASVFHGLQLQLFVYMNGISEELRKEQNKFVIPAGVLYYHIDDPVIEEDSLDKFIEEGIQEEKLTDDDMKILDSLAMDGLVSADLDVVYHLDNTPNDKPKVLPLKLKKGGGFYANSSVASEENFDMLLYHVKKKTRALSEQIFDGDISVKPFEYNKRTACDYCNYKAVCGFDPSMEGFEYHKLRKIDKDEIWEAISGEEKR